MGEIFAKCCNGLRKSKADGAWCFGPNRHKTQAECVVTTFNRADISNDYRNLANAVDNRLTIDSAFSLPISACIVCALKPKEDFRLSTPLHQLSTVLTARRQEAQH